jgi:hypothetical protein
MRLCSREWFLEFDAGMFTYTLECFPMSSPKIGKFMRLFDHFNIGDCLVTVPDTAAFGHWKMLFDLRGTAQNRLAMPSGQVELAARTPMNKGDFSVRQNCLA